MWRDIIFGLVALIYIFNSSYSAMAERRVALVIGNSAYKHAGELANPKNDAADIVTALKKLGFEIIEGSDLDKYAMDRKIREFASLLSGADAGLFFYAGHGLQVGGINYLVPIDAELKTAAGLDWEMIRLDLIQRSMERETKTNILFLDACRDNPLARNLARAMGTRTIEIGRGLAAAESGVGTIISYSTQPGNVAQDGKGRNSPFAGALAKKMATPGDDISALLINVRLDVMKATEDRQIPWEHSALTGRFYFVPLSETPVAKTEALVAPPVSPAVSPSEIGRVWESIKNSEDKTVLEAFRKQFGAANPFYDSLAGSRISAVSKAAEIKVAALQTVAKEKLVPAPDKSKLTRDLQHELRRVGCEPDAVEGTWGPKSKSALADFSRLTKWALAIDEPSSAALNAVAGQQSRVCPLQCGKDQIEVNGLCADAPKAVRATVERNERAHPSRSAVDHQQAPKVPIGSSLKGGCPSNVIQPDSGPMSLHAC